MTLEGSGPDARDRAQPPEGRGLTPAGGILRRIRTPEEWTEEERNAALEELFFEGPEWIPYVKRFFALIGLSTGIAAFGLISDSSAVVIGAMLVAPLMTPMLAIAAAVVYGRLDRIVASSIVLILGTLGALLVGVLVATLTPGTLTASDLSNQILARTGPGLLDLGIAITAGLAAGYVVSHRRVGGSLPGVAIAVALVPPLATAGITIKLGAAAEARGAMLLFVTNLIAIVLSAGAVMVASGFVPRSIRALARGHLTVGLLISIAGLVAIAVPLSIHTAGQVREERLTRAVVDSLPAWDENARVESIEVTTGGERVQVDLQVTTTERQPAWKLAERIAAKASSDIDLTVGYRTESVDAASTG